MDEQDSRTRSRRRILQRSGAALAGLALGAGTTAAVPDPGPSTGVSVQAEIDAADAGETVEIDPGTYDDRIVVDKPLTLRGVDRPTIDATGRGHGVVVRADDVTVEGFEIRGGEETAAGVTVLSRDTPRRGVTVSDNHVSGAAGAAGSAGRQAFGVLSWGLEVVSDLTVADNRIEDLGGPNGEDPQGVGINLQCIEGETPGAGARVEGNEVRGVTDGDLDVSFASPTGVDRDVPPFGVAVTIQPLDGDESDAGSDGVLARRNAFAEATVDVVLGNRSDPMTSRVVGNDFGDGDGFGLVNVGDEVPAACNYWGHAAGPTHTRNLSGRGDVVLGRVDYRPWSEEEVGPGSEADLVCQGGQTGEN